MTQTIRYQFPFLAENQAGADILYNESLVKMDSLISLSVKDRDLTSPPGTNVEGDTYLLPLRPLSGDWASFTGIQAQGTLTVDTQPSNGDTMTIDVKVYTFQTVLTDVDGNIEIGSDLATTQLNILNAINLTGTPGTGYAASMTIHPTVSAAAFAANDMVLTAKVGGSAGNTIATTETFTAGTNIFDAATLGTTTPGVDDLVIFKGGVWVAVKVFNGLRIWVQDEGKNLIYDGLAYLEQTFNSPAVLTDLGDVNTAGAADGQVLIFDSGSGIWLPGAQASGGGDGIQFGTFITHTTSGTGGDSVDTIIDATNDWRDRLITINCLMRASQGTILSSPGDAEDGEMTLAMAMRSSSSVAVMNAASSVKHPFPVNIGSGVPEHLIQVSFYSGDGRAQPNVGLSSDDAYTGPLTKYGIDFPTGIYVDTSGDLRVVTKQVSTQLAAVFQMYFNIIAGPDLGGYV